MFTAGSLFSGIGGIDLAASLAGFDILFQIEIDSFCQKVLRKHADVYWPKATLYADVRGLSGLPYVDVLFGGFPCQDISVAGNGVGLEGERSGLWWEFYRLIGEIRPRAILLENVRAITYDGRGGTEVIAALARLGYVATWGIISASDAGAPHQRDRWFCMAYPERGGLLLSPNSEKREDSRHHIGDAETGHGSQIPCKTLGNSQILREQEGLAHGNSQRCPQVGEHRAKTRERLISPSEVFRAGGGQGIESEVGRDADGFSRRLDGHRLMSHQWPARPNEPQLKSEPPRLIADYPNRRHEIKGFGNAVLPQVVYPIFKALHERLSAEVRYG